MILLALAAGAISGAVILFFSHVAPVFGAGNFIRDIDKPRLFGKTITHREAHMVGVLTHLFISMGAGGLFAYLVSIGIFPGFGLLSLLGWSVVLTIIVGGVILPFEGHGLFGVDEDVWFPVDLFLTNAAWAILFWWFIRLWPLLTS
jgi:hypothetical protein